MKNDEFSAKRVGVRLRGMRSERHLTQAQMCEILEINIKTYQAIESGRQYPSVIVLDRVSEAFAVRLEWLLRGEGTREAANYFDNVRRLLGQFEKRLDSTPKGMSDGKRIDIMAALCVDLFNGANIRDSDIDARVMAGMAKH